MSTLTRVQAPSTFSWGPMRRGKSLPKHSSQWVSRNPYRSSCTWWDILGEQFESSWSTVKSPFLNFAPISSMVERVTEISDPFFPPNVFPLSPKAQGRRAWASHPQQPLWVESCSQAQHTSWRASVNTQHKTQANTFISSCQNKTKESSFSSATRNIPEHIFCSCLCSSCFPQGESLWMESLGQNVVCKLQAFDTQCQLAPR